MQTNLSSGTKALTPSPWGQDKSTFTLCLPLGFGLTSNGEKCMFSNGELSKGPAIARCFVSSLKYSVTAFLLLISEL